ncbi:RagB/SusD family nutrient uptake outer membrane protein [Niastella caeni]|uniref:RagB/SusD family nutrient uptake outer membrane protein n=1 Tax=Niastella caeni TaxID=2569763 RepID=A0A4S8HNW5_9BACT|nr:RagB/SusD family nutrient uptake outer membrane protein [Niastella caeni]THU36945.1 RagB/SusD family nutrient uptake outer membrane protein [Niastella caeni]
MNTIKNILLLFLVMEATGCKKFLDRDVEDQTRGTTIDYTNLNSMYSPVSGVYRTAAGDNPGLVHWMDVGVRTVRGDDVAKGSAPNDQGTLTDIKNFQNSNPGVVSFWGNNNYWNDHFGTVLYCNEAINDLDRYAVNITNGDNPNRALYNQYKSEIRVIRAWAHMLASRVFGDVPIVTNNTALTTVAKSSVVEVRQWIISEMDTAIGFLEDARPNQSVHKGAVTKYTALLLKAKAAADAAGNDNGSPYWDIVLSATNEIINSNKFSLFPDFYQLWKIPGKLSDEALFELQYTDFGTSTGTNVSPGAFFDFQGPNGNQQGSPVAGWGFMSPTQAIVDFFDSRNDSVRRKTSILFAGNSESTFVTTPSGDNVYGNSNGQTRFMGKAYLPKSQMTPGRTNYGSNNNVRVLRYADVLLLNAEAKVRKGQNGDAPFNLVRQRAKLNPITGVTLQNVLDERRAEFAAEWWGERYNDLIRTGQAATVLAPVGFAAGKEYLPVPTAQRDLNPNL